MNIRKALITAANPQQRQLPLQMLIGPQGEARSALRLLLAGGRRRRHRGVLRRRRPRRRTWTARPAVRGAAGCISPCRRNRVVTATPCSAVAGSAVTDLSSTSSATPFRRRPGQLCPPADRHRHRPQLPHLGRAAHARKSAHLLWRGRRQARRRRPAALPGRGRPREAHAHGGRAGTARRPGCGPGSSSALASTCSTARLPSTSSWPRARPPAQPLPALHALAGRRRYLAFTSSPASATTSARPTACSLPSSPSRWPGATVTRC